MIYTFIQQRPIVGPARCDVAWQSKTAKAFDSTQFEIDWQQQRVTCPQGKQSISWSLLTNRAGRPIVKVGFSLSDCAACATRSQCTRAKPPAARYLLKVCEHLG